MVDILKKEICNYCKNTECEKYECYKYETIEINSEKLIIYKCVNYQKDLSKIIPKERPLYITAERDYIKYYER